MDALECFDDHTEGVDCQGDIDWRMRLSPLGRCVPRCEAHWDQRLAEYREFTRQSRHALVRAEGPPSR